MIEIKRKNLRAFLNQAKGKFFSVVFVKKDGTVRKMNCRLNVAKYVKGVGMSYNPADFGYVTVWERSTEHGGAEAYRTVNLNTTSELTFGGITYKVVD